MSLTGGCQCGAVRYTIAAEPLSTYVCHCRECRRQSASAFGISVIVPEAAFALTQGEVRAWRRPMTAKELDRMAGIAAEIGETLADPWIGVEFAVAGIIQSPHFLFRVEIGTPDAAERGLDERGLVVDDA